ncbi:MAG: PP2C family protein-serine/threonine phosphatase [Armatimonadota bacterium]|nr:PP2C family protein-serine/threonine phosphatase [Armatimonadota bacterium]
MAQTYETATFQQMKALQVWRDAVGQHPQTLEKPIQELVRTLITLCAEYIEEPSADLEQAMYEEAHELAVAALSRMDIDLVTRIYRDDLVDAIASNLPSKDQSQQGLLRFSNLLTDAIYRVYTETLKRTIRHQRIENLSNELRVAKAIQERLIPKEVPKVEGFDFAGLLRPATEIGGDYWSIRYHPAEDIITVKLADVSGHGIAAATLVSAVKFISGGYFQSAKTPSRVMEQTNSVLVRDTPTEILVSMAYAWIYAKTKEISVVNAGHEAVFICNPSGCTDIAPTGPALGISEAKYGETRMQLRPNDIVVFASDGITEAGRSAPFGLTRLKRLVSENRHLPAVELARKIVDKALEYDKEAHDDMSLVAVKVMEDGAAEE